MRLPVHLRNPILSTLSALIFSIPCSSLAQSWVDDTWMEDAQQRLEHIYEKGLFRAIALQPSWSEDGTKLRIKDTRQTTGGQSWLWLQAATGEETTPPEVPSTDAKTRRSDNVSPDLSHRFLVRDGNLLIQQGTDPASEPVVTIKGKEGVRFFGMAWSPSSQYLAFIRSDHSSVRKRTMLVPEDPSYPGIQEREFARVGEIIATLSVGLVDTSTDTLSWIDLDPVASNGQQGFYLGQVEWAPGSDELLVEKLSRFRDRRQFLLANPATKQIKTLFDETNEAWAISSQGKNLGLIWLDGGRRFIVLSEKDGWRHAFLFSRAGDEIATLTKGDFDIIERGVVDEVGGWFYFYASPENGTQKYLYRVALDGSGDCDRVTPAEFPGTNDYRFSPSNGFAIHTYSTIDTPPVVSLVSLPQHSVIKVLHKNHAIQDRLDAWGTAPTEFVSIQTQPEVSMDAVVMKPRNFDPHKKYPVLVYVYGEPHGQTVLDQWAAGQSLFHRVITDLGYLVVSIDNRGTPAPKGAAWRRAVFGSLGPLSTEDQAEGIKKLAAMKPYVDRERVAIWGWSGGGSNTLNALFRRPDVYQVGIAVVPKPQPHLYNAWFQEIYMRTCEVNPEGYMRSAPLNFAEGLAGKLLMITGSGETNTHIQIIEGLVDRLIELGKPFDYMVYPNRDHGLSEGPGSRVHVRMLIARYLTENLPREPR